MLRVLLENGLLLRRGREDFLAALFNRFFLIILRDLVVNYIRSYFNLLLFLFFFFIFELLFAFFFIVNVNVILLFLFLSLILFLLTKPATTQEVLPKSELSIPELAFEIGALLKTPFIRNRVGSITHVRHLVL